MTENTKHTHTQGPWRVVRANPSPTTGEWMISGAKPGYLAEVRDCGSGDGEANARLIAAAPELLEALRGMMDAYMDLCDESEPNYRSFQFRQAKWNAARAAIAKATGEQP